VADGCDPLRPRVESLEEIVGRPVAERRIRDAHVHDGGLRPGPVELQEEAELPLATPERDAGSNPVQHRRSVTAEAEGEGSAPDRYRLNPLWAPRDTADERRAHDRRNRQQRKLDPRRQHVQHLLSHLEMNP
jgi:hypothetical protein